MGLFEKLFGGSERKSARGHLDRGIRYSERGDLDQAIAEYTEAIRVDPALATAYSNRGAAYYLKGDLDKAIADCTEAIRLDPTSADAYFNRAGAYNRKGDPVQAIADFTEVIRLRPTDADAYVNRAAAHRKQVAHDQAIEDCTHAIRINPAHEVADAKGNPDNERLVALLDEYDVDYVVLARYMRLIPPSVCWKFAGGRIINLHHGLLPAFPGAQPYRDAYSHRMLTYGATVHFIVPELDAGDQIIHQDTFTVAPGTSLEQIMHIGETDHEPACLVEGLRRVLDREVELHFHRVVAVNAVARR